MKHLLALILIVAATSTTSYSQSFKLLNGDTINRVDAKGKKQGKWLKLYDNNQPFSITWFKNDKAYDTTFTYYKTGELYGHLIHGKDGKTDYMISYWPNGNKKATGKYISQLKDSTWNYYNEKDTLTAVEVYKSGKANGVWKIFYPSGVLSEETTYVDDTKNGPFKKYYPNGIQKMAGTYKNDTFDGPILQFHLNGKPYIKGTFEDGLKQGEWIYMNDRGVRDSSVFYNYGVIQE